MKKLFIILITSTIIFASDLLTIQGHEHSKQEFSKELNHQEQQQMIEFLKKNINNKNRSTAFEIGLVYEDGIIGEDGVKTQDKETAIRYFIKAFEMKDYRVVFKLVTYLLEEKQKEKALEIIQEAINNTSNKRSLLIGLVSLYATVGIDYFPGNSEVFMDALVNLSKITNKELDETPTLKFLKANIMNVVGDRNKAEILLNQACFASNTPIELRKICMNPDNFLIASDDVKKSIDDCDTCTLLK